MEKHLTALLLISIQKLKTFDSMAMDMVLNGQPRLKKEDFMSIKISQRS
jgi:hypothetical protein